MVSRQQHRAGGVNRASDVLINVGQWTCNFTGQILPIRFYWHLFIYVKNVHNWPQIESVLLWERGRVSSMSVSPHIIMLWHMLWHLISVTLTKDQEWLLKCIVNVLQNMWMQWTEAIWPRHSLYWFPILIKHRTHTYCNIWAMLVSATSFWHSTCHSYTMSMSAKAISTSSPVVSAVPGWAECKQSQSLRGAFTQG